MVRMTPAGLDLVGRLDEPVHAVHREQLGHLGGKRLKELSELLTVCRDRLAAKMIATVAAGSSSSYHLKA
jgi:hypothetical protein